MTTPIKLSDNCTVEPLSNNFGKNQKDTPDEHPNETNIDIVASCENCRNQNSKVCREWIRKKRYYSRKFGYKNTNHEKDFCLFWAYQPVGLWSK